MTVFRSIWFKPLLKVVGVTLGLALACRLPGVREVLHPDNVQRWAASLGWTGAFLLLLVGACAPIAFLPRLPFAVLFGLAYGVGQGVLLASLSGVLGAALHYKLAATLLTRRETEALEALDWFRTLKAAPHPFFAIVALRIFPFSNFAVTNLVCGLLRIPFWVYLSASLLGMVPSTVIYVLVGHGALHSNIKTVVWALALSALLVILTALWRNSLIRRGEGVL